MSSISVLSQGILLASGEAGDYLSILSRGLLSFDEALAMGFDDRFLTEARFEDGILEGLDFSPEFSLAEVAMADGFLAEVMLGDQILSEAVITLNSILSGVQSPDQFLTDSDMVDAFILEASLDSEFETGVEPASENFLTEIQLPDLFEESEEL